MPRRSHKRLKEMTNNRKGGQNRKKHREHNEHYFEDKTCPHPEKQRFASSVLANEHINMLYSRSTRRHGKHYLPERERISASADGSMLPVTHSTHNDR